MRGGRNGEAISGALLTASASQKVLSDTCETPSITPRRFSWRDWKRSFATETIYGGQDGVHRPGEKKLGYYTYKLMTEKFEGSNCTAVETVREDTVNKVIVTNLTAD